MKPQRERIIPKAAHDESGGASVGFDVEGGGAGLLGDLVDFDDFGREIAAVQRLLSDGARFGVQLFEVSDYADVF